MAAPPTLEKHTMWEAVPPGDSSARQGGRESEQHCLAPPIPQCLSLGGSYTVHGHRPVWNPGRGTGTSTQEELSHETEALPHPIVGA